MIKNLYRLVGTRTTKQILKNTGKLRKLFNSLLIPVTKNINNLNLKL